MKSSAQDLRKRGMALAEDYHYYSGLDKNEIIAAFINSDKAYIRTAAAREIARRFSENEVINLLINRGLRFEKNLYTKIEICEGLLKNGIDTARALCENLGAIGNNQYKKLPESCSKKKSYPLPRDIAARTLSKMRPDVLPAILGVLDSQYENKISEAIDAIGFMLFYNKQYATIEILEKILKIRESFSENKIIQWKIITCLSSFVLPESRVILNGIIIFNDNALFRAEAGRSLNLIKG